MAGLLAVMPVVGVAMLICRECTWYVVLVMLYCHGQMMLYMIRRVDLYRADSVYDVMTKL